MNYLDTLKGSDRERYSRKLQCLYGRVNGQRNSCQELDPYYTMTTTLFAHQNGGHSRHNRSIWGQDECGHSGNYRGLTPPCLLVFRKMAGLEKVWVGVNCWD